jgi:hypothetical protein
VTEDWAKAALDAASPRARAKVFFMVGYFF